MNRFRIVIGSVACAMAVTAAWAQQDGQDPSKTGQSTGAGAPREKSVYGADKDRSLSPTGRMTGQALRGSKLTGAEVKDSQGQSVGRIEDVIINPTSGRIEFGVISFSGGTAGSTTPGTSTSATGTTTTASAGKLVPVPWTLLRSSASAGTTATTPGTFGATATEQPTFALNVDRTKLQQAPSFDRNSWPDISESSWRQRIFSHYGSSYEGRGSAESPSGTSTSSENKNKEDNSSSPKPPGSPDKR